MKLLSFALLVWVVLSVKPIAAQTPTISSGGVLNAASFATGQGVTPGSLISVFGTNLSPSSVPAPTIPLPKALNGVQVTVNGIAAPLLFVSSGQINAQLPWETAAGTASVIVINNGASSAAETFQVAAAAPGLFSTQYGVGQAIAINLDGSLAAPAALFPGSHTAQAGDTILLLCTGLGAVTPTVADGANSMDTLRTTVTNPTVYIGGVQAEVSFSGLSPQFTGVYQLNIVIPDGVAASNATAIQVVAGGITTTPNVSMAVGTPPPAGQVPSQFQDTYNYIDGRLTPFISQITGVWDGSKSAVAFGTEVTPADAYASVTQPNYYANTVTPYLNALQSTGAKIVKFQLGFPLLYQPFYTGYLGDTDLTKYNAQLSFYKQLVSDLHNRGIQVIVQSVITPAQNGAYAGDPLDLTDYYPTLSFNDYVAGRTANAVTAAQQLLPDYINVESEPDNEGSKAEQPELNDPDNNLTLVNSLVSGLESAGIAGLHSTVRISAGMGSWQPTLQTYLTNYTGIAGIDVIDIHVHPIISTDNIDCLQQILTIASGAIAANKGVGMDEDWMNKTSPTDTPSSAVDVDARDNWSFWAPLDQLFVQAMVDVSYYYKMAYLSFSVPNAFFSYVDFEGTPGCPTAAYATGSAASLASTNYCSSGQWDTAGNTAVGAALQQTPVPLTSTGQDFVNLTK